MWLSVIESNKCWIMLVFFLYKLWKLEMLSETSTCKVSWNSNGCQSRQIKCSWRRWRVWKLILDLKQPWWLYNMRSSQVICYMHVQFMFFVLETVSCVCHWRLLWWVMQLHVVLNPARCYQSSMPPLWLWPHGEQLP